MQNAKHIDIVVKYFFPVAAGIETNVMETYRFLVANGWDITIHTSKDTLTEKNVLPDVEIIRGLNVQRYPYTWFGYFPAIDWNTTSVVALHNFNILPHFWILLYGLWLKFLGKKKFALFVTPHGGYNPEWTIFSKPVALAKKFYHYTVGALLINLAADGVRAVSEWERSEMLAHSLKSGIVKTISNGIEDEALLEAENPSPEIRALVERAGDYIIQIGRIYPIKNYETTIKALVKVDPRIKYVIAGPIADLEYKKVLDQLINNLKLNDRVIFAGVIRGSDKFYLISRAFAMVHMAIWESFCNVVHEGMSQGLPCIVANNTALPYLVKNDVNGWCVETYDVDAVAQKINHVYGNQQSPEILGIKQNNRAFGLSHSWRNVSKKMEEFYLEKINLINPTHAGK
jgi:glycosyltransferase involved in cell wall biosynthesis